MFGDIVGRQEGHPMDDYAFYIKADLGAYIGQWVAVCNQKIVSHGKDVKKVLAEAKTACPGKKPLIARVPDKETMIF
jgi:hypothetical protein